MAPSGWEANEHGRLKNLNTEYDSATSLLYPAHCLASRFRELRE